MKAGVLRAFQQAQRVARETGIELAVHAIGAQGEWQDVEGRFEECYGTGATGAVLVRPDGFVAWCAPGRENHSPRQLKHAVASLLGK